MSKTVPKCMALLKEASEMFSQTGCVPGIDGEEAPACCSRGGRVDGAVADADVRGLVRMLIAKRGPAIIILSGDCHGYRGTLSAL